MCARVQAWRTAQRGAELGICVQFLALLRTLLEYFRLAYVEGSAFNARAAEPYIIGGIIAAALCWAAVGLYFWRRYRSAAAVTVATVIVLLIYKILAIS